MLWGEIVKKYTFDELICMDLLALNKISKTLNEEYSSYIRARQVKVGEVLPLQNEIIKLRAEKAKVNNE